MGKNTVQAKQWLDKCCSDSASWGLMVEKWFVDFKRGRMNADDAEPERSPKFGNCSRKQKTKNLQNDFGGS